MEQETPDRQSILSKTGLIYSKCAKELDVIKYTGENTSDALLSINLRQKDSRDSTPLAGKTKMNRWVNWGNVVEKTLDFQA